MISECIERITVSLSAALATRGNNSQKCIPGTLVRIGLKSPRISTGASGLGSKVSCCGGPPPRNKMIQDLARPNVPAACTVSAANRSPTESPRQPNPPSRIQSLRLYLIPGCPKAIKATGYNRLRRWSIWVVEARLYACIGASYRASTTSASPPVVMC